MTIPNTFAIRRARLEDVPAVVILARAEYDEEHSDEFGINFKEETADKVAKYAIEHPDEMMLLVVEETVSGHIVGELLGQYCQSWLGDLDQKYWCEISWYVSPAFRGVGAGFGLYDYAEQEVIKEGKATIINVSMAVQTPQAEWLRPAYERRGYRAFQMGFYKPLKEN